MIKFLSITFLAFFAIYIFICLYIYFNQEKLLFYPSSLNKDFTYNFDSQFEELFLKQNENTTLNCLHFKSNNPKGVILYFHGNAGSLESWGQEGEYLAKKGFDCLIYDYPGFGKSTGKITLSALNNSAVVVYDFLKSQYKEEKIIIIGRSIGTGLASTVAKNNNPGKLLLISPYKNLENLAQSIFPYLPVKLLLKYNLDNEKNLQKIKCPVFIIHGEEDEVIPYQQSMELQKLLKSEDLLIKIPGAHHNDLAFFQLYHNAFSDFLYY